MNRLQELLFHFFCVKSYRWPDAFKARSFQHGFESTASYFQRLGNHVDVRDKTVLDVGCGSGATCIYVAQQGARQVTGIDIDEISIAFANAVLVDQYRELADKVTFKVATEPAQLSAQKFDIILSKDSFEHIADPESYLRQLQHYVADDGIIVIGFGPLWKSPYGGHITFMTRLPWAHLLFPERVIMKERRLHFGATDGAETFEQVWGGLNKMTFSRFKAIIQESELEPVYLKVNAHDSLLKSRLFNLLRRVPLCEEYFTFNVYGIWRLKKRPAAVAGEPVGASSQSER
ncbi:MAG: class I SAM-dependent methyltransferase [Ktedonobacteraceae bacterium]|nr:class I SAM-dependent methyltransferase [Ktedonobacteraceae bacterium]